MNTWNIFLKGFDTSIILPACATIARV